MEPIRYAPTLGSAETSLGLSNAIWKDCPMNGIRDGSVPGYFVDETFSLAGSSGMASAFSNSTGKWATYGYAGATLNDHQVEGGALRMAADDDAEGLTLLSMVGSFRLLTTSTLALNRKLWFEVSVARSTITTDTIEFFVGLMNPTLASSLPTTAQPITTTDDALMTAGDLLGFHCNSNTAVRGGPTEVSLAFGLASGTVNYPTNLTTLMASSGNSVLTAGAFVKLGFVFDPNAFSQQITAATARQTAGNIRRPLLQPYINGLKTPAFLSSDDVVNATAGQAFPTSFLAPVLSVMNTAGSSPGYIAVRSIRCYQLASN